MKRQYKTPVIEEQHQLTLDAFMDIPSAENTLPGTNTGGNTDDDPTIPYNPDSKEINPWEDKGLW